MALTELIKRLETKIKDSYEQGVTADEAEKLASEFLHAQMMIAAELRNLDLDARMKKSGVKAIRAAIYLDICSKADKKPTESQIAALIDTDKVVGTEQQAFDQAEVDRNELERYYDIFGNGHIHFRTVAKGSFS